jgi:hypothetical protein
VGREGLPVKLIQDKVRVDLLDDIRILLVTGGDMHDLVRRAEGCGRIRKLCVQVEGVVPTHDCREIVVRIVCEQVVDMLGAIVLLSAINDIPVNSSDADVFGWMVVGVGQVETISGIGHDHRVICGRARK